MGDTKREKGQKPKNPTPSQPSQSPPSSPLDDVFSLSNIKIIPSTSFAVEITTTTSRPRGRPKKLLDNPDHLPPPPILSPCCRVSNGIAIGVGGGSGGGELAVDPIGARVVPTMDTVVKVFCVHTEPNFSFPWKRKGQYSSSSSGFVISGRRVLTNAHSIKHYIRITRHSAMLTVDDDEFWEGVSPVEFGELPALQDAVTVVGYPIGGDTISVTSGVVSRLDILFYVHGSAELLGLQIDAAINSGNYGGPAFNDKGNCVGIAFQSLRQDEAENKGYVIPTPVIQHFIQD
ncbi:hypothetical protein J1N35_002627 [Gossypium stocksii]|uniref:Protease Do-like 9 n=1 Tax=Gossypium stocksii TaxID=47602 RepID=A0A9D3WML6_9ROSI|nr:hypothetical protein J1N35_002627 [Gossypium stocksii]